MADPVRKGTSIHYYRSHETVCRPAKLLDDSFEEHVTFPVRGTHEFGHLAYGDLPGSDSKHTFQTLKRRDPLGTPDTWHLVSECPLKSAERPGAGGREVARSPQAP